MNLQDIRAKYPEYSDLSDDQLVKGFHDKYYSDIPLDEFSQKIGYSGKEVLNADVPEKNGSPNYAPTFQDTGIRSRLARGVQDFIDRGAQLSIGAGEKLGLLYPGITDDVSRTINHERNAYQVARVANAKDGKPGVDVGRAIGLAGTLAPLGLIGRGAGAGYGATALNGALQGGAAGLLAYDPSNSLIGTAENTVVGALTGAVVSPVVKFAVSKASDLLAPVARKIGGFFSRDAATSQTTPTIPSNLPTEQAAAINKEAADQIASTRQLNSEALARKSNLLENGVTPTKAIVTRNPQDFALERNLSKLTGPDPELQRIGGTLTDIYQANDHALAKKLSSFRQGLPEATPEGLGQNVINEIGSIAKSSQKDVSKVYAAVRDAHGEELASDAKSLFTVIDDLKDSPAADSVTQAATRRLKRLGMIGADGQLTNKTLTVKEAEGLRQFINQQPSTYGKQQIINAIDDDVVGGAGEDIFKGARSAAYERFKLLKNPATQKALDSIGELSQGKTAQNFIRKNIVSAADQDVDALLKTVDSSQTAKDSIKAGVIDYLQEKAVDPRSGRFSGAAFSKALDQIGDSKLLRIFGQQQTDKLRSLSKAAVDATYQPAYAAVNASNSAPALLSFTNQARKIPIIGKLATDELQKSLQIKAYQSQLANVLAARSDPLVTKPQLLDQLPGLLSRAPAPLLSPLIDRARDPKSKR